MRTFSPSEAAFEGFRVVRAHPGAVAAWAIAYVVAQLAIGALVLAVMGERLAAFSQYSSAGAAMPPEAAAQMIGPLLGLAALILPLGLFLVAVFADAVYRPILRPDDKGLFYLKIGGDEGRQVLLYLAWIGVLIAGYLVLIVAAVLVAVFGGLLYAALTSHGGNVSAPGPSPAPRLVGLALVAGVFCAFLWLMVRFSLAAPMTFALRRVSVFGSWRVTRGKFWSLLGCYVLAWIFGILVALAGWIVSLCAGAVITGDWAAVSSVSTNPRAAMMTSGFAALTHDFTVAGLVQLFLSSLLASIGRVIMYAPTAAAYRDLAGAEPPMAVDAPFRPTGGLVL